MENYAHLIARQREFFQTHQTKALSYRLEALKKLQASVNKYEGKIMDALKSDLNKSPFESYATEIGIVLHEIRHAIKHAASWAKPKRVKTPLTHFGSTSKMYPEPYGVALLISPWNYPFQLLIAPLIAAIAAGNCAVLKPSEWAPATSGIIADIVRENYPAEYISVVQGGVETSQALLREKFDYIFFTGSVAIGRAVMQEAAKHLTPVTLELGGKSPCIVHRDADLKLAAKRIAWGKLINAGQTCVAPDYLYVHHEVKEPFLARLQEAIAEMFGADPLQAEHYVRIVNAKHFDRLVSLIDPAKVRFGGGTDRAKLAIEPTLLDRVTWDDPVMQEEIFGPILPVLEYDDISDTIPTINARQKPLALYLFSESKQVQKRILREVSFGGGCVNDTVMHVGSPYLPFGGVGESGIGAYHGKAGFDAFSHYKSIVRYTTKFDVPFRYPHVTNGLKKIKMFLK